MQVVCIVRFNLRLTVGKKYEVLNIRVIDKDTSYESMEYEILCDDGNIESFSSLRFKPLSEVRKNKLRKIC